MELDFDKYCVLDGSPTTVLQAPGRRSKVSCRKSNGNELLSTEIGFNRYRSASCRDARSRRMVQEGDELLKRGSVYQSSKEVKLQRRPNDVERKKNEFSQGSASTFFSFGIIDSLCSLDEDKQKGSEKSTTNSSKSHYLEPTNHSLYPILERTALLSKRESAFAKANDSTSSQEIGEVISVHKSLSAKLSLPHSPAKSDSDASSPMGRVNPVLKMLDPFVKSKSQKSQLKQTGSEAIICKETVCKSLLNDLSNNVKDSHDSNPMPSPAHLHGILKMERKHGMLFFEFSVKSPEDVYVAKTCKVDNPLSCAYTFHSLHHTRKSNASAWCLKENSKEFSVVGQMLVSCYLCAGAFNDSMVTEFVLYDVSHSRRSISSQDSSSGCSPNLSSSHYESPLPELHPGLETAAIIMEVPFEKRESLKYKPLLNLVDLSQHNGVCSPGKLHVVIPSGNHSLPCSESRGPSPLLDKWRLGGGCDCGGWDMACPLNVCGNPNFQISEGQPLIDTHHPAQLFIQGRKDKVPAFTMRRIGYEKYEVDFHAQLSTLQAFSICVAIMHAGEDRRSKQMLQSDYLRVFAEEEIKHFINAISKDENVKANKMEEALPSFVKNPPFSPIARV